MNRPDQVKGVTVVKKTGCGKMYVTDNTNSEFPEIFIRHGKAGTCTECWCQALGRVISFALRFGDISLEERKQRIIHALKGIQCPNPMWCDNKQVLSCPDGIAQALECGMGLEGVEGEELEKDGGNGETGTGLNFNAVNPQEKRTDQE